MYRLGVEAILGLQRKGDTLLIDPCIPQEWSGFTLEYRNGETHYHVAVHNPRGVSRGVVRATLDGEQLPRGEIPLLHDGTQHQVEVWMG
jgi:cyclic beta-1,2-glucan synthetase